MADMNASPLRMTHSRIDHFWIFSLHVDFTFFGDTKVTVGGHLGNDKMGGEGSIETVSPRYIKHVKLMGMMDARTGLLSVSGNVL